MIVDFLLRRSKTSQLSSLYNSAVEQFLDGTGHGIQSGFLLPLRMLQKASRQDDNLKRLTEESKYWLSEFAVLLLESDSFDQLLDQKSSSFIEYTDISRKLEDQLVNTSTFVSEVLTYLFKFLRQNVKSYNLDDFQVDVVHTDLVRNFLK